MAASILFIGKKHDFYCERALEFVKLNFPECEVLIGNRGDHFPEEYGWWEGDYIISYLSPWIIPDYLLKRAKQASINFHTGPPEYPGIGCTNFAIYNEEKEFGITCHHMNPKVDSGEIISVVRFPIFPNDTVYSITQRCYSHILSLFYNLMSNILKGEKLPTSNETWKRPAYKRSELNELCKISMDMPMQEITKRVKATTYPNAPGAYIQLENMKFIFDVNNSAKNT